MADTAALSIAETIRQSLAQLTPTERRGVGHDLL